VFTVWFPRSYLGINSPLQPSPHVFELSAQARDDGKSGNLIPTNHRSFPVSPFDADTLARHRHWVSRMAAGEKDALRLLYLEFGSIVHGIVRRVLEDPEDAREAVQDSFIKAWRQAASYRPERGEVVAWLVFVARHSAIDRLRKGARRRLLHEALQRETYEPIRPGREVLDQQDFLTQQLTQLSSAQRQSLELAFFGGCSQNEIAAAMNIPVGNVKNHLRRGLLKLRQLVTRHD
jgi:RNA polymerase sigma-70 factor, ECF subfamily